jgi:uncharacterized protein (DUF2141 family)
MKYLLCSGIFASLLIAAALGGAATSNAATTAPAPMATLTVRVVDLRNHKGQLVYGVFTSAAGFPSDRGKSVDWQIKPIDGDVIVFTSQLPPGKYAASVLHDENCNNKMDYNFFGVPDEGYGVTNNPKPRFRAARFDEALFTLPPQGATMTISIQYF